MAVIEWLSHCLIVAAILAGMRGLQVLVHWLWGDEELMFLGLVPLEHLFHTADFLLLAAVLTLGIACVVRAYRGRK